MAMALAMRLTSFTTKEPTAVGVSRYFATSKKHTAQRLSAVSIHDTNYIREKKQKQVFTKITIRCCPFF